MQSVPDSVVQGLPGLFCAHREGPGAPAERGPGLSTRGEITGRVVGEHEGHPLAGRTHEGALVAKLQRSGGAFDPEGPRSIDVTRADDLVAVVRALPGRWVFITLTVDRRLFTGPEAAYQRCNEYVRKAVGGACPKGVFFSALEVQTKTGDGWPHWHVLAWCPDDRPVAVVKAAVLKGWRTRTETIDQETGEVTRSSEPIGVPAACDVQEVRDAVGAGKYIAKYMMKAWKAVPPWMLESRRRFRKVRLSTHTYDILEGLHRHDRHRGARKTRTGTGRRTRTLLQRMAASGSSLTVFRVADRYGRREFVRSLPVPRDRVEAACETGRLRPLILGPWRRMVFEVSPGFAALMKTEGAKWRAESKEYERRRAGELAAAWADRHSRREELSGGADDDERVDDLPEREAAAVRELRTGDQGPGAPAAEG